MFLFIILFVPFYSFTSLFFVQLCSMNFGTPTKNKVKFNTIDLVWQQELLCMYLEMYLHSFACVSESFSLQIHIILFPFFRLHNFNANLNLYDLRIAFVWNFEAHDQKEFYQSHETKSHLRGPNSANLVPNNPKFF